MCGCGSGVRPHVPHEYHAASNTCYRPTSPFISYLYSLAHPHNWVALTCSSIAAFDLALFLFPWCTIVLKMLGRVAFEVLRRCHAQVVPQDRRQPRLAIQCADVIASCLSRLSTTEACLTVRPCDRHLLLRLSTMAAGHAGPRLTDMPSPYRRRRSSSPCVRPRVVSDRPLRNSM